MTTSPDPMAFLSEFVRAYQVPAGDRGRQPAMFLRTTGGLHFQHHGFGDDGPPPFDESVLAILRDQSLIDIEYHERSQSISPSARGEEVAAEWERLQVAHPVADIDGVVAAVKDLAKADSPTAPCSPRYCDIGLTAACQPTESFCDRSSLRFPTKTIGSSLRRSTCSSRVTICVRLVR